MHGARAGETQLAGHAFEASPHRVELPQFAGRIGLKGTGFEGKEKAIRTTT